MAKIAELKKYLGYEFSSGAYTGEDYKSFQTKYINYLKAMCRDNHWRLVNIGKNHYFSLAPNGNNFSIILPHRTPMPIHISTISKPANISGWICPKRRTAFRTTSNAGMTFA